MAYTTINKSSDYFKTVTYTGNGAARTITVGMQPDLVFTKSRDAAHHGIFTDAVTGAGKRFTASSNSAQDTTGASVASFVSTGYTLTDNSTINGNNEKGVSWNWKMGGTGSTNNDGSVASTVSVNTTAGHSIVKWTAAGAATVGHGLGAVPKAMLTFRVGGSQDRFVYHVATGNDHYMRLNQNTAKTDDAQAWQDTTPTSSVFTVGTQFDGSDYVAHCFAEKTGYSKFGLYYGNSDNNGPFVYCGFKPSMIMIKETGSTSEWFVIDSQRSSKTTGGNTLDRFLRPSTSDAETDSAWHKIDFLSNGFKIQDDDADINDASYNYLYMAFAEAPLVGSNNIPCTAR